MNNETNKASLHPIVVVAGYCAGASVMIVAIALALLNNISDGGMWAIAAMAAAPALMGIGIAYFMTKQPQPDASSIKSQSSL